MKLELDLNLAFFFVNCMEYDNFPNDLGIMLFGNFNSMEFII